MDCFTGKTKLASHKKNKVPCRTTAEFRLKEWIELSARA